MDKNKKTKKDKKEFFEIEDEEWFCSEKRINRVRAWKR